jgi:hypothetical protein
LDNECFEAPQSPRWGEADGKPIHRVSNFISSTLTKGITFLVSLFPFVETIVFCHVSLDPTLPGDQMSWTSAGDAAVS